MRKSSRRQRAGAAVVAVVAMVVVCAVRPAAAVPHPNPNPLSVPFYSQQDPHWRSVLVGAHEDVPMRKRGSLLTCIAMVADAPKP